MIICDICPSTSVWSGSGLPSERWWWYEIIFYCGFTSDSVPFTHQPVGYHSFTVIIKQTNGINSSQSKKILLLYENYCEGERRDKCGEENKTWRCYLICINVTVTNLSCYTSQLQLINGKLCRSRRCSIIIFIFVDDQCVTVGVGWLQNVEWLLLFTGVYKPSVLPKVTGTSGKFNSSFDEWTQLWNCDGSSYGDWQMRREMWL